MGGVETFRRPGRATRAGWHWQQLTCHAHATQTFIVDKAVLPTLKWLSFIRWNVKYFISLWARSAYFLCPARNNRLPVQNEWTLSCFLLRVNYSIWYLTFKPGSMMSEKKHSDNRYSWLIRQFSLRKNVRMFTSIPALNTNWWCVKVQEIRMIISLKVYLDSC